MRTHKLTTYKIVLTKPHPRCSRVLPIRALGCNRVPPWSVGLPDAASSVWSLADQLLCPDEALGGGIAGGWQW